MKDNVCYSNSTKVKACTIDKSRYKRCFWYIFIKEDRRYSFVYLLWIIEEHPKQYTIIPNI